MLDSGSSGNFISANLAKQLLVTPEPLKTTNTIIFANGNSTLVSEFCTVTITLLETDLSFKVSLSVIPELNHPVILGIPWLRKFNPSINWDHTSKSEDKPDTKQPSIYTSSEKERLIRVRKISTRKGDCPAHHMLNVAENLENGPRCEIVPGPTCSGYTPGEFLGSPDGEDEQPISTNEILSRLPRKYHEFASVFSKTDANDLPPERRKYDCAITLKDPTSTPPYKPLYNLSAPELDALQSYITENLAKGFIRPSKSPAGAPIFFVKKKSGELRPCVDYRGLNEMTIKNRYPLPLISELLDRLGSARVFTKIDLRGAYNLVRIKSGDEWKTAFRSRFGHFEYVVMPFGLTNAPAVFQDLMNDVFRDYLDQFVIIYLDDILIFSPDQVSHDKHVSLVLERLQRNNLYGKLEKSEFDKLSMEFLGFVITTSGIEMSDEKISAVKDWKEPTSRIQVQSFLGFTNFYRRFILNYAKIARPLTELTRVKEPFVWDKKAAAAFQMLRNSIMEAPVLIHPDHLAPFTVETDASDYALGAVLLQLGTDNLLHPVAFYSRKLTPAEINYTVHDKELLAILCALKHWRHYLVGSPHQISVFSDHKNLTFFSTLRILKQRHARWAEILSEFDFVLCYKPGMMNPVADALSRRSDLVPKGKDSHEQSGFNLKFQEIHSIEELTPEVKLEILRTRHDNAVAGHPGIRKTYQLVAKHYNWTGMRKYVTDYVRSCDICQRAKATRHKPFGLLQPLPAANAPWSSISMDFIVKLPQSNSFDSILVVVCRRTKMAHFIPCNEKNNASQIADLFMKNIFKLHGLPENIVSDRGPQFTSKFWKLLFERFNVKINLSSAYHPQTDGQTERVNQCLEQYLRVYTNYQQNNWSQLLSYAEFSYNNSYHTSTSMTPFEANYGFNPKSDHLGSSTTTSNLPALQNHLDTLKNLQTHLEKNLESARARMKLYADKSRLPHKFQINDKVMLSRRNIRTNRPSEKLDMVWIGPFTIVEQINDASVRLDLPDSLRIHPVFHVSLLEPYVSNTIPNRVVAPPPPVILDESEEFVVSEILDSRIFRGKLQYLVQWEGYGPSDNSWEPAVNVQNSPDLVASFHTRYPNKPRHIRSRRSRSNGEMMLGTGMHVNPVDATMAHAG